VALNIKRIQKGKKRAADRAEERKKKGGGGQSILRRLDVGVTMVAICPPHEEMDGVPYVQADQHFGLNPGHRAPCFSLAEDNEGVWLDPVQEMLAKFNEKRAEQGKHVVSVEKGTRCPIQAIINGDDPDLLSLSSGITDEQAGRMKRKETYWFPYVPLAFAPLDDEYNFSNLEVDDQRPWLLPAPPTLYMQLVSKIEKVVYEQERDPTDPMGATLFTIKYYKDNKGFWAYDVDIYSKTLVNPLKLPKGVRRQIKEMCVPGGAADPHRFIAGMLKDEEQIIAIIKGSAVEEKKAPAGDDKPKCFGFDCEPDDEECQACPHKKACAKKCKVPVPPSPGESLDDEGSDDTEDEEPESEPEPKKKRKTRKKKAKPEPEPEPEPEPDDDDDDDDIPDFSSKSSDDDEDDEDEKDEDEDEEPPFTPDEEEEDEEEDDEPPVAKDDSDDDDEGDDDEVDFHAMLKKRKAARKAKKSK